MLLDSCLELLYGGLRNIPWAISGQAATSDRPHLEASLSLPPPAEDALSTYNRDAVWGTVTVPFLCPAWLYGGFLGFSIITF